VDALRALLAGESLSRQGRYVRLDRVQLGAPPATAPPVLAGAEGPRTLRLVGGHADGAILTGGTTPEQVVRAREHIEAGRAEAGRTGPHPITVYVLAAGGPDARDRIERDGRRWGFPSTADRAAYGSVDDVAAGVSRWVEAGVDTVVLQPTADEPDLEGFMAFAAEVGRALTP